MPNRRNFWITITKAIAFLAPLLMESSGITNPAYSHVVVVVEENHGFNEIIGGTNAIIAPYINNILATEGVVLTNAYGEQHPSQPNYDWLFSGSNQGITNDTPPTNPTYNAPNIYTELQTQFAGTTQSNNFFGGYVDGWPGANNAYAPNSANYDLYAQRHVPWLGFNNINGGNPSAITQDFTNAFPTTAGGYASLPVFSMVIPQLNHDMHDYSTNGNVVSSPSNSAIAIQNGDNWLSNNLSGYASWAKSNNSLLIVTWDEDSSADWNTNTNAWIYTTNNGVVTVSNTTTGNNPSGLTAPNLGYNPTINSNNIGYTNTSGSNQIAMIFYGANLATNGPVGTFGSNASGVNNLNLYDTIQSFYGIANYGTQSDVAIAGGLVSAPITDIFTVPEPSSVALVGLGIMALFIVGRRRGT